jgi:hypothetical protein
MNDEPINFDIDLTAASISNLRQLAFRIESRIEKIEERDGSPEAAVTGPGVGISYLLAKDIFRALSESAALLERMPPAQDPKSGEFAIVELFGRTTLVGRVAEVERFGGKLLAIEPLFNGTLLPAVFHAGAAIYRLTPCSAEVAYKRQPTQGYQLPPSVAAIVPPELLPAPEPRQSAMWDNNASEDDDRPF